jgi:hypothetical protein
LDAAAGYLDQALAMAERDGFGHEVAEVAGVRALVARDAGDLARAKRLAETALLAARQHGRQLEAARALFLLGSLASDSAAKQLWREALGAYCAVSDRMGVALAIAALANCVEGSDRDGWFAAAGAVLRSAGNAWSLERFELERLLPEVVSAAAPDLNRLVQEALSATVSG